MTVNKLCIFLFAACLFSPNIAFASSSQTKKQADILNMRGNIDQSAVNALTSQSLSDATSVFDNEKTLWEDLSPKACDIRNKQARIDDAYAAATRLYDEADAEAAVEKQAKIEEQEKEAASTASNESSGVWNYGNASTYGVGDGLMGGTTASGATVTESSMGIAMLVEPLGTTIEIAYNGNTVIAVVNDRGPYVGGRVIDMQPAVARALGFSGAGRVQWRVI